MERRRSVSREFKLEAVKLARQGRQSAIERPLPERRRRTAPAAVPSLGRSPQTPGTHTIPMLTQTPTLK